MARQSKASVTHRNNLQEQMKILEIQKQALEQQILASKLAIEKVDKINYSDSLKVSDHAIVRYLERVAELDIEQVRARILTPMVEKAFEGLKTGGEYPTGLGYSVVIKKGVITTVVI
jgi:hypothetical protein